MSNNTFINNKYIIKLKNLGLIRIGGLLLFCFVVLGFAIHYFYGLYKSIKYDHNYQIDFKEEYFKNNQLPLYFNEDLTDIKFGASTWENDKKYNEINGSPISFVFQPEEYLWSKNITVSSLIKDEGDWQIKLFCNECDQSNKNYKWSSFYYGNFNDYKLVASYDGTNVFSKNDKEYNANNTIDDWVANNVASNSSILIKDNSLQLSKMINSNIDFQPNINTEINHVLRGPHQFYVFLQDKLNLEIIKKDLNNTVGKDEVKIVLYDVDENIVHDFLIEDDGIENADIDNFAGPIKKTFEYDIPSSGVYLLSFEENNSSSQDWLIKYIKINTNKIVFTGQNLILDPTTLYTEINNKKDLRLYAWHSNAVQNIEIKSTTNSFNYEINRIKLGVDQLINFTPEKYIIGLKGDQYISGANFALNPESYFEPFIYDLSQLYDQDYIVSIYNYEQQADGWTKVSKTYNTKYLTEMPSLKKLSFQIRNTKLEKIYDQKKELFNIGMFPLAQYENFELWGKKDISNYNVTDNNLSSWLKNVLPKGSSLNINEKTGLAQSDFINSEQPEGFNSSDREYNFSLRGSHQFYVYLSNNMSLSVVKEDMNAYDGTDSINFGLINYKGETVCSDLIEDDGNITSDKIVNEVVTHTIYCGNIEPGTYIMNLDEVDDVGGIQYSDFFLKKITINTNKIIVKDKILNTETIELYNNANRKEELDIYHWHKDKNQIIKISASKSDSIDLSDEELVKHTKYYLEQGEKRIFLPKGDVIISGANFAFSKENWFDPELLTLKSIKYTDFALIDNIFKQKSYIKNIQIEVK